MEEPISSSIFPEKDNKIEISSKNINIAPRFEDIVDIKNYSIKNINPIIIIGPDWCMYVCFCGLISFGYSLFFITFWKNLNLFYKICGICSYSIYFLSYTGTFLLNPGYPERNENSLKGVPRIKYKFCNKCEIYERIDRKICHCIICGICIEGFDHHCPWTGKCIGRKTIHFFNTFLYSILGVILYFILALLHIDINKRK